MEDLITQKILEIIDLMGKQLDEELGLVDTDNSKEIREERLKVMKKIHQKQAWIAAGHGEYSELVDENEFLEVLNKSKNIVCLFYKDGSPRCNIADMHLDILAKKHVETRFCKLNVEQYPFLTQRLKIRIIPAIALIKDSKTTDYIVAFTDLDNIGHITTEMVEWRIAQTGAIMYHGYFFKPRKQNTIRGNNNTARGSEPDD